MKTELKGLKGGWNGKMQCGHLRQYGTLGEVFPVHCLACENDRLRRVVRGIRFVAYQPPAVRAAVDDLANVGHHLQPESEAKGC
jgi:hypothetical protein